MTNEELHEARTNPEFLNYLEKTKDDAIESKNISALYEVLDSLLILDLDEEKINTVYENILKISFENVEDIVNSGKKITLESDGLYYTRAFYEHAIEKWSYNDLKGAKELFFVLSNIIEDELLCNALNVHLIACSKDFDLDKFYEENVNNSTTAVDEKYGYFIVSFNFKTKEFLEENSAILETEYENLKYLLD
ncbi:conserved hypothetical protein [Arcobacter nitrofigilis DSM 7299]|uniref:Uncharacterized protein n=1 Tax=Arcobacter nitrofigilis (strain ATCC 33309 / DSM 7299 / CCUG 15893 / LMG 7604 / NCTC 12251 / CI) TaxID=572480 RepID=D5V773_ARCNC|nr:hypothetical protein [Arcobacter nitrofigilis]ADG94493.1 conserved hypothetical protein [Arcobacter nitrofigilis DSM 7299]